MRLLLLWLALFAMKPALAAEPIAEVEVVRDVTTWTADYELKADAPAWAFHDSILPRESKTSFRAASWSVETPGVRVERHGWYDALVAANGTVPRKVRIRFTPYTKDIEASYDAALAFSDGSVALYDRKFKVVPVESAEALARVPIDADQLPRFDRPTRVRMRDSHGKVLAGGERVEVATLDDAGTYVLFGPAPVTSTAAISALIDPSLPQWLKTYLTSEMPAILAQFADRLGPAPGGRPTLLVSWAGATPGVTSMGGSVLPAMVVMTLEGEGVAKEDPRILDWARWFAAHEAAHFWLGQAIGYDNPQQGWITEGGAELLAFRAIAAGNPGFDVKGRLNGALKRCASFLEEGGVAAANERGDHKAYYDCGAIIALTAEKASDGDFAAFVKALIERHGGDKIVTRAEWLELLEERSPGRGLAEAIAVLLDGKPDDPNAALADLLQRAGIAFTLDGQGTPQL